VLDSFRPTALLLALDGYHLAAGVSARLGEAEVGAAVRGAAERILACWRLARDRFTCQIIQQIPLPVHAPLLGNNEHRLAGSRAAFLVRLAAEVRVMADHEGVDVLALDAHAARNGVAAWHDPLWWHRAKQEVSPAAAAMYGELVMRLVAAKLGRSAKCLVLDLDNTLWGGVVGDDGLDALVFLDDNPFERALVRRELPMVAVPELSDEPATYAQTMADAGYFEGLWITDDDRARTAQYQSNREREAVRSSATDLPSYLRSLEMQLLWRRFDRIGLQRTVQLINKTNQVNLTTRRYTEADVLAIIDDPRALGLQLRLLDRFGDNGIIAILIGRLTSPTSCPARRSLTSRKADPRMSHSPENAAAFHPALTEIFRDLFMRDIELRPDLTAQDVQGWDSLKQIEIIVALEERYQIKFGTRELDALRTVGDLARVVAGKACP
jgi:predicted enzyme involved in methoxymalonyl-ACP biosynthesis/acyl carrier protein